VIWRCHHCGTAVEDPGIVAVIPPDPPIALCEPCADLAIDRWIEVETQRLRADRPGDHN